MDLTSSAVLLWLAGFLLDTALGAVLLIRRRYRTIPVFSLWIGFQIALTALLYVASRTSAKSYRILFWGGALVDFLLQLGVIGEIARFAFVRRSSWVLNTRHIFFRLTAVSFFVAGSLTLLMKPATDQHMYALVARANLFSTVFITFLFTAVMLMSRRLGLTWQTLVVREGYGFTFWTLTSFVLDALQSYQLMAGHFLLLEHVRMVCYLGTLLYWCAVMWAADSSVTQEPPDAIKASFRSMLAAIHMEQRYADPLAESLKTSSKQQSEKER